MDIVEGSYWCEVYAKLPYLVGNNINSFYVEDVLVDGRSYLLFDEEITKELVFHRVKFKLRCGCGSEHTINFKDFPLRELLHSRGSISLLKYPFICDCVASEEFLNGSLRVEFPYLGNKVGHITVLKANAPELNQLILTRSGNIKYDLTFECVCDCGVEIYDVPQSTIERSDRVKNKLSCGCKLPNGLTGGSRLVPIKYRFYKGGRFVSEGTLEEIHRDTGYDRRTLSRYATPSWHKTYLNKYLGGSVGQASVMVKSLEEAESLGLPSFK